MGMQVDIPADLLDKLLDLEVGQPVTLKCCTSEANIFLKANAEPDRIKCVPEPVLLREIPYLIQGMFQGIQYGEITYAIVQRCDCNKLQSVPIGAITKVIEH